MTAVEPAMPIPAAIPAGANALPEPLRPATHPRTDYWDAADACWHCGGGAAQVPAPRTGD
jgi:hypothetical protein